MSHIFAILIIAKSVKKVKKFFIYFSVSILYILHKIFELIHILIYKYVKKTIKKLITFMNRIVYNYCIK